MKNLTLNKQLCCLLFLIAHNFTQGKILSKQHNKPPDERINNWSIQCDINPSLNIFQINKLIAETINHINSPLATHTYVSHEIIAERQLRIRITGTEQEAIDLVNSISNSFNKYTNVYILDGGPQGDDLDDNW